MFPYLSESPPANVINLISNESKHNRFIRLIRFNIPAIKIGSGECNNYPLVDYIAKFNKPIILSTGMNSIETIARSTKIIRKYNKN